MAKVSRPTFITADLDILGSMGVFLQGLLDRKSMGMKLPQAILTSAMASTWTRATLSRMTPLDSVINLSFGIPILASSSYTGSDNHGSDGSRNLWDDPLLMRCEK